MVCDLNNTFNLLTMKTYLDQHLRVLSAPSLIDYVAGKIEAYGVNGSALVLEAAQYHRIKLM